MECTYCPNLAKVSLVGTKFSFCQTCQALANANDWEGLAERWLKHKPQDWQGDVAAYLETSVPEVPRFALLGNQSGLLLPADLVDPDPGDWTMN